MNVSPLMQHSQSPEDNLCNILHLGTVESLLLPGLQKIIIHMLQHDTWRIRRLNDFVDQLSQWRPILEFQKDITLIVNTGMLNTFDTYGSPSIVP